MVINGLGRKWLRKNVLAPTISVLKQPLSRLGQSCLLFCFIFYSKVLNMKNKTSSQILEYIAKNGPVRPSEIALAFNLSAQAVHWHLRKFKASDLLAILGNPPHTHYKIKEPAENVVLEASPALEERFSYISPRGEFLTGEKAFLVWLKSKGLSAQATSLSTAYDKLCATIYENLHSPFSTKERLEGILSDIKMKEVYISDFYALPQFGKTTLGNLVHAAKTSDSIVFTKKIALRVDQEIGVLIKRHKIDSIAYVPHSIPRKVQFLPELKKILGFSIPEVRTKKLFFGDVPVAQKSLSKVSERIENAEATMSVPIQDLSGQSILLIDDALGSGATLNALSKKLLSRGAKDVTGYAVVGSYKGFEVISQV